jgi:hypothetical protein
MAQLRLAFKFANWDNTNAGVGADVRVPASSSVADLKRLILQSWPQGYEAAPADPGTLRLFCMGAPLVEGKTLAECRIPQFDYPTPVHVAVRPGGRGSAPSRQPGEGGGLLTRMYGTTPNAVTTT